jgi:Family of unknown function (DUF6084)
MAGDWKMHGVSQGEGLEMSRRPELDFTLQSAEPLRFGASPHIVFKLKVANSGDADIHSVILRCQIQLDAARRHYTADEQTELQDLFGDASRWADTLRSLLWANTSTIIPGFSRETTVELQVPCTFDFNVATTKYFAGIKAGDIPVSCFFSGTVFYDDGNGALQATQIPWDKEAAYRMPLQVWREMMDSYYPNAAWLCLRRDVFERLHQYKIEKGIPTFDEALSKILDDKVKVRIA